MNVMQMRGNRPAIQDMNRHRHGLMIRLALWQQLTYLLSQTLPGNIVRNRGKKGMYMLLMEKAFCRHKAWETFSWICRKELDNAGKRTKEAVCCLI